MTIKTCDVEHVAGGQGHDTTMFSPLPTAPRLGLFVQWTISSKASGRNYNVIAP